MKKLLFLITLAAGFGLVSCEPESIPTPTEDPPVQNEPTLYVRGNFQGTALDATLDGERYFAVTTVIPAGEPPIPESPARWQFELYQADQPFYPVLVLFIVNHTWELSADPQNDLAQTTDSTALVFLHESDLEQRNRVVMEYLGDPQQPFNSALANNDPLRIIEAKDTLVDGEDFRVLKLEGDVNLVSPLSGDSLALQQFSARIALGTK